MPLTVRPHLRALLETSSGVVELRGVAEIVPSDMEAGEPVRTTITITGNDYTIHDGAKIAKTVGEYGAVAVAVVTKDELDEQAVDAFILAAVGRKDVDEEAIRRGAMIYGKWRETAGYGVDFNGVSQQSLDGFLADITGQIEREAIVDGLSLAGYERTAAEIMTWSPDWRIEAQNYVNAREAWAAGQGRDDGTDIAEWYEREPKAPWFLTGAPDPTPDMPF